MIDTSIVSNSNQPIGTNVAVMLSTTTTTTTTRRRDIVGYDSLCPNRRDTSSFKKVNDSVSNEKVQEQVHGNNNDTLYEKTFLKPIVTPYNNDTDFVDHHSYHRSKSEIITAQSLSDLMFFGNMDRKDQNSNQRMSMFCRTIHNNKNNKKTIGNKSDHVGGDFVKPSLLRRNGTILK